jgi:hypothetical protein
MNGECSPQNASWHRMRWLREKCARARERERRETERCHQPTPLWKKAARHMYIQMKVRCFCAREHQAIHQSQLSPLRTLNFSSTMRSWRPTLGPRISHRVISSPFPFSRAVARIPAPQAREILVQGRNPLAGNPVAFERASGLISSAYYCSSPHPLSSSPVLRMCARACRRARLVHRKGITLGRNTLGMVPRFPGPQLLHISFHHAPL